MTAQHDGIHLADGFHFTDHLASPYQLVYSRRDLEYSPLYIANIDGSERRILIEADETDARRSFVFSPDGTTLYLWHGQTSIVDMATGEIRDLINIPQTPPFYHTRIIACAPDNRTLLLMQTSIRDRMIRGLRYCVSRLCRITTEGTDFRALYEGPEDYALNRVAVCWKQGFAIMRRVRVYGSSLGDGWFKVDLNSGDTEPLTYPKHAHGYVSLRDDGTTLLGSGGGDQLYTYSLRDGAERRLPITGYRPAWSPDGRHIAYMEFAHKLCLWNTETEQMQPLLWYEPSNFFYEEIDNYSMTEPRWSPDGQMLWFTLSGYYRRRKPYKLSHLLGEAIYFLHCVLHNLFLRHRSHMTYYPFHRIVHKTGVVDLSTQQVMLYNGYLRGVTWLPRPENGTKA